MGIQGSQDIWRVGARVLFRRDPIASVAQPWRNLGIISEISPTFEIEKIQCEDPSGGVLKVIEEAVTSLDETYDLTLKNFSPDNLALLFLSDPLETFTQAADELSVQHFAHAGHLLKLNDAGGVSVHAIDPVAGVFSDDPASAAAFTTATITDIVRATRTISMGADIAADLSIGEQIVVRRAGLSNALNSRTYTIESFTPPGGDTDIVVEETPAADETGITGTLVYVAGGDTGTIYDLGTDWSVDSLQRGIIRMIPGGAFAANANIFVVYTRKAVDARMLLRPQSAGDALTGDMEIYLGRGGDAQETIRRCRASIVPSSVSFDVADFANFVLSVTVLADEAGDAGILYQPTGAIPPTS